MKYLVGFLLPLCIFSFIAFGLSVAILGTGEVPETQSMEESIKTSYVLGSDYSRIDLTNTSGDVKISPNTKDDTTIVVYGGDSKQNSTVKIEYDTLKIESMGGYFGFGKNGFNFSLDGLLNLFKNDDYIHIYIPQKQYNSIVANNLSGSTTIVDIAAALTELSSASGDVTYVQPEDFKSERLDIGVTSGSCRVYNADTYSYKVGLTSGNVEVFALTGKGDVEVTSGNCTLNYESLNGDLSLDVSSGNIDINLPADISAEIFADIGAGNFDIDHGTLRRELDDEERITLNGGKHRINAEISSGNILISDEVRSAPGPKAFETPALSNSVATTATHSTSEPEDLGITVNDSGVDVDLGVVGVEANDYGIDVNVGPVGVQANDDGVRVQIGDFNIVDIS